MTEAHGGAAFGLRDPVLHHVNPKLDADHPVRVVPGRSRKTVNGELAACGDCRGAVKARWVGQPGGWRLEVVS